MPATPKATTPYAGAVEDDVEDEPPRDASFEFSCVFGEGAWPVKPKGKLSLVVAPEETISTARCAVAAKLDLEVDRIRLRDASNGEDIGTAADLEEADVVCQIVRGELVTDGQVEDLARLKSILGDNAIDESTAEQREALDASIEARRAVWRAVPPAHGAAAATREDVVHLEVSLNALQKLVASIDSTTTWDAEMVAKVDERSSRRLDPAVNAAVARIRARVDERAALVAERVAERLAQDRGANDARAADAFHGARYGARRCRGGGGGASGHRARSGCFCSDCARCGQPPRGLYHHGPGRKNSGGGMCCSAGDNGFCQNTTEATDWARKETVHTIEVAALLARG